MLEKKNKWNPNSPIVHCTRSYIHVHRIFSPPKSFFFFVLTDCKPISPASADDGLVGQHRSKVHPCVLFMFYDFILIWGAWGIATRVVTLPPPPPQHGNWKMSHKDLSIHSHLKSKVMRCTLYSESLKFYFVFGFSL